MRNIPRIELGRTIEVIAMLAERWPACFVVFEKKRRPLKIGIDRDIAAALGDSITLDELEAALGLYTRNISYLDILYTGAPRYDLEGKIDGAVTGEQARGAAMAVSHAIRKRAAARARGKIPASDHPNSVAADMSAARATGAPMPRLSLADLKMAAARRRAAQVLNYNDDAR